MFPRPQGSHKLETSSGVTFKSHKELNLLPSCVAQVVGGGLGSVVDCVEDGGKVTKVWMGVL